MEQNQELLDQIRQKFALKQMPAHEYSPLVLAYIGDGIYDMVVRTIFVSRGNTQVDKLNKQASGVCRASSQAAIAFAIAPLLTEAEASTYRRGRNARSFTKAKNATMSDYRHATGLEALCGYLYLNGETDRLLDLLLAGFVRTGILEFDGVQRNTGAEGENTQAGTQIDIGTQTQADMEECTESAIEKETVQQEQRKD